MFPQNILLHLNRYLAHLKSICCIPTQSLKPVVRVKNKRDFNKDDVLKFNRNIDTCPPNGLREFSKLNRKELLELDINYISVDNKKWFFYTHDKIGQFFLEDGSRKVEIEFPVWMEMQYVFETKGIDKAVHDVLSKCMDRKIPKKNLADCFPGHLCRAIYNDNPQFEATEAAVLELLQVLTKETQKYMENNCVTIIANSAACKEFTASYPNTVSDFQKVRDFLSGHHEYMFNLAEKLNLIKNANLIPLYENIRNHLRHPDTTPPEYIQPQKIYDDFCSILMQTPNHNSQATKMSRLDYNTVVALNLQTFSCLAEMLDACVDPLVKKKKNNGKPGIVYNKPYFNDLIKKGLLTKEEKDIFDQYRHRCRAVAHHDNDAERARRKLIQKHKDLDELILKVSDRVDKYLGR
ncbi:MAG: hypothetical protein J6Y03_05070 [Alphaproteobacteria bacterium]|nr:hypothetical protein [Alphaproteobacteria bacterium]